MSQSMSAGQPRRPTLGIVAMAAGAIGAIACVIAIVAVLSGRTWIQERVDVLQNGATGALSQALDVGDQAIAGLTAGTQQATQIRTAAEGLAANPALDEAAINALQARLAPLAERYSTARERYVSLREKASGFLDSVKRLEAIVPTLDLPEGPTDLVTSIDEKLTGLDQAINDLAGRAAERASATDTATAIAAGAARLEEGLTSATELATNIRTNIAEMQGSVEDAADRIAALVTYGALGVALVMVWVLVLNLALIALGRRWRAA